MPTRLQSLVTVLMSDSPSWILRIVSIASLAAMLVAISPALLSSLARNIGLVYVTPSWTQSMDPHFWRIEPRLTSTSRRLIPMVVIDRLQNDCRHQGRRRSCLVLALMRYFHAEFIPAGHVLSEYLKGGVAIYEEQYLGNLARQLTPLYFRQVKDHLAMGERAEAVEMLEDLCYLDPLNLVGFILLAGYSDEPNNSNCFKNGVVTRLGAKATVFVLTETPPAEGWEARLRATEVGDTDEPVYILQSEVENWAQRVGEDPHALGGKFAWADYSNRVFYLPTEGGSYDVWIRYLDNGPRDVNVIINGTLYRLPDTGTNLRWKRVDTVKTGKVEIALIRAGAYPAWLDSILVTNSSYVTPLSFYDED